MTPLIENKKKNKDKSQTINQREGETLQEMMELDLEKFASDIAKLADLTPETAEAFINYAKKNPKNIVNWLSVINPTVVKEIEVEKKSKKQSAVIVNFNTNIFHFKDSQATVSTGDKSAGTLLSEKIQKQLNIKESIIEELHIISDENPKFSEELKQFEEELEQAKTPKDRASILTRLTRWYNEHKDEIQYSGQLITHALAEIYNILVGS